MRPTTATRMNPLKIRDDGQCTQPVFTKSKLFFLQQCITYLLCNGSIGLQFEHRFCEILSTISGLQSSCSPCLGWLYSPSGLFARVVPCCGWLCCQHYCLREELFVLLWLCTLSIISDFQRIHSCCCGWSHCPALLLERGVEWIML
jgi:hypothetical protein